MVKGRCATTSRRDTFDARSRSPLVEVRCVAHDAVPGAPVPGAKEKDWVENYLHQQVCAGAMTLQDAQHAIVTDWYAVYVKNHHGPKSSPVAGSSASPTAGTSKQSAAQ